MTERLVINLFVVAGVLGLTWGPLLYLVHTVHMYGGAS